MIGPAFRLHHANSKRVLAAVVRDGRPGMYRVRWPDLGLSDVANLTRCCDAARRWAERQLMTEPGKLSTAARLKSLNNFSWSSSPIEQKAFRGIAGRPAAKTGGFQGVQP
jgi:hypothetical protein